MPFLHETGREWLFAGLAPTQKKMDQIFFFEEKIIPLSLLIILDQLLKGSCRRLHNELKFKLKLFFGGQLRTNWISRQRGRVAYQIKFQECRLESFRDLEW